MFLSLLLATTIAVDPNAARAEVQRMFRDFQAGHMADAYSRFSTKLRGRVGAVQMAAFLSTRRAVYGDVVSVAEPQAAGDDYEVDIKFEKGEAKSTFGFAVEDGATRIDHFALPMPPGKPAVLDEAPVIPVVRELLDVEKGGGAPAVLGRLAEDARPTTPEEEEQARGFAEQTDQLLGKMKQYKVGKVETTSIENCRAVISEGQFEYGTGQVRLGVCWDDGLWQLRNATWEPDMTPALIERVLPGGLPGGATVKCPHDAAFPVGGEIVCRVTAEGEAADARVRRTSRSGFEVVGIEPAKQ